MIRPGLMQAAARARKEAGPATSLLVGVLAPDGLVRAQVVDFHRLAGIVPGSDYIGDVALVLGGCDAQDDGGAHRVGHPGRDAFGLGLLLPLENELALFVGADD